MLYICYIYMLYIYIYYSPRTSPRRHSQWLLHSACIELTPSFKQLLGCVGTAQPDPYRTFASDPGIENEFLVGTGNQHKLTTAFWKVYCFLDANRNYSHYSYNLVGNYIYIANSKNVYSESGHVIAINLVAILLTQTHPIVIISARTCSLYL